MASNVSNRGVKRSKTLGGEQLKMSSGLNEKAELNPYARETIANAEHFMSAK